MKILNLKSSAVLMMMLTLGGTKLACSQTADTNTAEITAQGGKTGEYRGAEMLSQLIGKRINSNGAPLRFSVFLGDSQLVKLLGSFGEEGGVAVFQNANPNSVNLLLYNVLFRSLSENIAAQACQLQGENYEMGNLKLSVSAKARFLPLCSWPAAEAQSDESLNQAWLALMLYDAPQKELEAWRNFLRADLMQVSGQKFVAEAIFTIMLNPHFLLQK